jgi:hypothetical protein
MVVSHRQAGSGKPPAQVPQIPVLPPEAVQKDDGVGTARIRWIAVRQESPPGEMVSRGDVLPSASFAQDGRKEPLFPIEPAPSFRLFLQNLPHFRIEE